ncbi:hypothetical protein OG778_22410 [Streptomyces sp. NBC_00184]|uniref:hypothetical protein n=1 Tax=Streptomyces sp. NBC_00184 TaxID=2975673 RepID=UPI002E286BAB|nr:hypothetical protein [Streptomyces sp. NBC_00184]
MIGADLVEAITLIVVLPFWYGLAKGFAISKRGSDLRADHPDFDAERDRLLHALGPASISEEEAATRLLAVAARTALDYAPRVPDDDHLPSQATNSRTSAGQPPGSSTSTISPAPIGTFLAHGSPLW